MLGVAAPDPDTVKQVSTFCALWFAAYAVSCLIVCRQRTLVFNNRVVSLLHAVVALVLAATALNWRQPFSGFGTATTEQQV